VQETRASVLRTSGAVLVGTLLIAGCGQLPTSNTVTPSTPVAQAATKGLASVTLTPTVVAGGYQTQAVVHNYTSADIFHIQVVLYTVDASGHETPVSDGEGGTLSVDVWQSELSSPVTFSNLYLNTTYRARCFAYKAAGTNPSNKISIDSASYEDIKVTNNDRPTVLPLPVKLTDVVFDGEATASGVVVTPGSIVSNGPVEIGHTHLI